MANGRKLPTSRSERYLGSMGYYSHGQGTAASSPEFGEEDVWSVGDDAASGEDHAGSVDWGSRASAPSHGVRRPPPPADHHHHHQSHHQTGGLSVAFDDASGTAPQRIVHQFRPESPRGGRQVATSAPVDVPDWSKIYRVNSVESFPDWDDGSEDSEMVPPHEYLARSRKMAANSVFEGVGRTLKGRDLSRVRDAVWSQTGFDG